MGDNEDHNEKIRGHRISVEMLVLLLAKIKAEMDYVKKLRVTVLLFVINLSAYQQTKGE